ncbi:erg24, C-14 sterol reductase, partial [Ascosphaera acerosa]
MAPSSSSSSVGAARRRAPASGSQQAAEPLPAQRAQDKAEHHDYEFFGPPGAVFIIVVLPIVVYALAFVCNDVSGCPAPSLLSPRSLTWSLLKQEIAWPEQGLAGLYSQHVFNWVLAYYGLLLFLQVFFPGTIVEGVVLSCGGRHQYKLNVGTYVYGPAGFPVWTFIWDHHIQIITSNMVIATAIAVFCYARSFTVPSPGLPNPRHRELAEGGHTGNVIYDFFIGRELNPRVTLPIPFVSDAARTVDLKVFCELRPGILGWVILNLSNIVHQYTTHGHVTLSILLVAFTQVWYALDSYYNEPAVLTTMDIIMDGFGFMLSFGDLVWVPFTFSLQTRYLAIFPAEVDATGLALTLAALAVGYTIFRGANNQKNRFRTNPADPRVAHLKYIETASGSKLLISGWWGMARHINYLGDWILSWSYCIPTGIAGYVIVNQLDSDSLQPQRTAVQTEQVRGWGMLVTYFYLLYFATLLVHRELRDEAKCQRKYGKDWK